MRARKPVIRLPDGSDGHRSLLRYEAVAGSHFEEDMVVVPKESTRVYMIWGRYVQVFELVEDATERGWEHRHGGEAI